MNARLSRHEPRFTPAALLTWLGGLVMVAPVAWMVLTGFKTEEQAVTFPPKLFFAPTFAHYLAAFDTGLLSFGWNSVLNCVEN